MIGHRVSPLIRAGYLTAVCAVSLVYSAQLRASPSDSPLDLSQSGFPGLLQVPTAKMPAAGTIGIGFSHVSPYNTVSLSAQPMDWLYVGAKYIQITNQPYCAGCDHSLLDKSFDVAVRLWDQSDYLPAVAVGIVDIGGTGLFSSEYLVATRRFYDIYATLGLGWGRLGSRGDFKNPARLIADRFATRSSSVGQGGTPSVKNWFAGEEVSVIGGIEWRPAYRRWSLLVELDGNDYSKEASSTSLAPALHLNFGAKYRIGSNLLVGLSYLRGDTVGLQLAATPKVGRGHTEVQRRPLPEMDHLRLASYQTVKAPDPAAQFDLPAMHLDLRSVGIAAHAIDVDLAQGKVTIWASNVHSDNLLDALRAAARIVFPYLPPAIRIIEWVEIRAGVETVALTTSRMVIEAEALGISSREEVAARTYAAAQTLNSQDAATHHHLLRYPAAAYGINPALRSNIGGLGGTYLSQFVLKPFVTVQIAPQLAITTALALNVAGNLDQAPGTNSSSLPHVRSDLERYQSSAGDWYVDTLEANYFYRIAPQWYGRFSAGIFEENFGGAAAEVLYRPLNSRLAIGVNVNEVQQRDYDQRFSFLDYRVTTGHLTFYYDTPLHGIQLKASLGRYLAKDVGGTLEVAKRFANGATFGAFATKTNVSAQEFGEGSFDKGIFLRLPLNVFFPAVARGNASFDYRFLTRDGGQKVDDGRALYDQFGNYHAGWIYGD